MITLINPPQLKGVKGLQVQSPTPPLGLAYIGAFLKAKGLNYFAINGGGRALNKIKSYKNSDTTLIQGLDIDEIVNLIPSETKIIGITTMFSHNWPIAKDLSYEIRKKFPQILLVLGGEHGTATSAESLNESAFDIVVNGEGEETFYEICKHIAEKSDWKVTAGITFKDKETVINNPPRKRIVNLNDLPLPDWESWNLEEYINRDQVSGINLGRSMPILGSRGCPFQCTFCASPNMWTTKYIMRNPKDIVDEMELMTKKYQVTNFNFMDLTFIVHGAKVLEFANELIKRNLNITYQIPAGTRCEAFDEELAFALERSGLRNLALAPESGSDEIRQQIKKRVKLDNLLNAIRCLLKTNITVCVFFVMGFPKDTRKSLKETVRLIRKMALMGVHDVAVSAFYPYPGSHEFHELKTSGKLDIIQNKEGMIDFFSISTPSFCAVSPTELHLWQYWAYLNFYLISGLTRPWRFASNIFLYFLKGTEKTRYMKVFSELLVERRRWKKLAKQHKPHQN